MKLTWYGHSCFLLETQLGSLVFDPYAPGSVPGLRLPPLTADCVVCSHAHNDHSYARAVRLTGREPSFALARFPLFHDDRGGALRGPNTATLVEAEGLRLVHLGDLGHALTASQVSAFGRVDVLLVPVGGYYTVDAAAAHQVCRDLGARVVVPMHYRGPGFGYDVISTLDPFLALSENVRFFDAPSLTLTAPLAPMTAVLTLQK